MPHTHQDRSLLLARIRRIKGQVAAIEAALDAGDQCSQVLNTIAACRGALNGLMVEVMAGHIRHHVMSSTAQATPEQEEAADEVISVLSSYLK